MWQRTPFCHQFTYRVRRQASALRTAFLGDFDLIVVVFFVFSITRTLFLLDLDVCLVAVFPHATNELPCFLGGQVVRVALLQWGWGGITRNDTLDLEIIWKLVSALVNAVSSTRPFVLLERYLKTNLAKGSLPCGYSVTATYVCVVGSALP